MPAEVLGDHRIDYEPAEELNSPKRMESHLARDSLVCIKFCVTNCQICNIDLARMECRQKHKAISFSTTISTVEMESPCTVSCFQNIFFVDADNKAEILELFDSKNLKLLLNRWTLKTEGFLDRPWYSAAIETLTLGFEPYQEREVASAKSWYHS